MENSLVRGESKGLREQQTNRRVVPMEVCAWTVVVWADR